MNFDGGIGTDLDQGVPDTLTLPHHTLSKVHYIM